MILLDHIVLNATNVEKTVNFYRDLLNVPVENWQAYLAGETKFPSLRISDTFIIDVFPPSMWQRGDEAVGHPNLNHFCLAVEPAQWQQIYDSLDELGLALLRGPGTYWGAQGDATSIYLTDPDGSVVEIRKYP